MTRSKETLRLIRLHTRLRFNLSGLREQWKSGRGRGKIIGFSLLILYTAGCALFMYMLTLLMLFRSAVWVQESGLFPDVTGLPELILAAAGAAAMLMCFVFGAMALYSLVFHAKDMELYAALPLRQQSVFAAKSAMVYLTEIVTSAAMLIPAGIAYTVTVPTSASLTVLFWFRLLCVLLVLPMIPLALAALAALLFTRVTARLRKREQLSLVLQMLWLTAVLGMSFAMQSAAPALFQGTQTGIMADIQVTMRAVLGYFPPALWMGNALAGSGLTALWQSAALLAASAACLFGTLTLASKTYYKGVLTQLEVRKNEKPPKNAAFAKTGSSVSAVARKEWKIVVRTPVYAMNALTGFIIFPLVFLFMFFGPNKDAMSQILSLEIHDALLAVILAAVMGFFGTISPGASTTFSREGKGLELMSSFPLSAKTVVSGKLRVYQLLGALGVTAVGAAALFAGFSPVPCAAALVMGLSCVFPSLEAQLIKDAASPKLNWSSEAEAIKQNMNSLFGMLFAMVSLLPALAAAIILLLTTWNLWLITGAVSAVNLALTFPLRKLVLFSLQRSA